MSMNVLKVTDPAFSKYGKILENYDCSQLLKAMEETPLPEDVVYVPSVESLESLEIKQELEAREYGELPIQIGYCNGHNYMLNAVEYHRSSEINIPVTDIIVLLGSQQDIKNDYTYETKNIEAFYIPAGTIVEFYGTTLHYAPCNADSNGFRCVVVLPKNTNEAIENTIEKRGEDALLFAKNKWLIGHKDTDLKEQGGFIGLIGENLSVKNFVND